MLLSLFGTRFFDQSDGSLPSDVADDVGNHCDQIRPGHFPVFIAARYFFRAFSKCQTNTPRNYSPQNVKWYVG